MTTVPGDARGPVVGSRDIRRYDGWNMRLAVRHTALALTGLLATACGTPLVDTSYRGVPLLTVRGQVFGSSNVVDVNDPTVRLALFWVAGGLDGGTFDNASEQVDTGVTTQVPAPFVMNIFSMPRSTQLISQSDGKYGIAHVFAYVDANRNGKRDDGEPIVGTEGGHIILAAIDDLTADESPTGTIVTKGLHIVTMPLACVPQTAGVVGGTTCGVPLGQPCMFNADCGEGTCLQTFIQPWPSGGCGLAYDPMASCQPTGAVVIHGPGGMSYWIEACKTDADCKRGFPYVCDLSANACLPSGNMSVQVSDDLLSGSLCKPAPVEMVDGGRYPYPDGGCPLGPGVTQAGPDDAGMCPPPPDMDGGLLPYPDGGCPPGQNGEPVGPDDAGFCSAPPDGGMPPGDGGLLPPFPDGGCPPGPDGQPRGPDDAGLCTVLPGMPSDGGAGSGVLPYPDGGCPPGPDGQTAGPDDAGYCAGPPDGGMVPPPDGGMVPPPDGGMMPPPDGGMMPPPDGGMMPPPDGGMMPPPDGGMMPPPDGGMPPPDGGMMPPPDGGPAPFDGGFEDAGTCPPGPDGGIPPRDDAGLCPMPPDGGEMGDGGDQCPAPAELDGGLCPGPNMTLIPALDGGGCPPPPRNDAGQCPGRPDAS
jgi:hypothetical protein